MLGIHNFLPGSPVAVLIHTAPEEIYLNNILLLLDPVTDLYLPMKENFILHRILYVAFNTSYPSSVDLISKTLKFFHGYMNKHHVTTYLPMSIGSCFCQDAYPLL